MKIRQNEHKQIEVKFEDKKRYSLLFHRINNGEYEQYIKNGNEIIILKKNQMKQIKKFIEQLEVENEGDKR